MNLFDQANKIATAEILAAFRPDIELRPDGQDRLKANCPFHKDPSPSFTVYDDHAHCFGCGVHLSNVDLILKLGLASEPLEAAKMIAEKFNIKVKEKKLRTKHLPARTIPGLREYAAFVNVPEAFLTEQFSLRETESGIAIPYLDEHENEVGIQLRHRLRKLASGKDNRFSWFKGKPYLYGAWALKPWRELKVSRVVLCEGASDVHVCWYQKVFALGVPGASVFKAPWATLLLPFSEIAVIQEPGDAGTGFAKRIGDTLREENYQGLFKAVSLSEKDPRDLWLRIGEEFKETLEAAIEKALPIDLYPEVASTKELIEEVAALLERHIFFRDKKFPFLIAVWVLGTYVYDIFTFYGYLWVKSPRKRCGKSLLLDIFVEICAKATARLNNPSESTLFRIADKGQTIMLDELENLRSQDKEKYGTIMSILNAGFQKGGKVPRSEKRGDIFEVVYYNVFSPKALAGINRLADTIEDRCFKIPMVRKTRDEKVRRFNLRRQGRELQDLRRSLNLWAEARRDAIVEIYDAIEEIPELASVDDDRLKDIAEPLVSIVTRADAEAANGSEPIAPTLYSVILKMAGERAELESGEAIVAFVALAEEILAGDKEVFIESEKLLSEVKGRDGLKWIESTKALGSFLSNYDLVSRRNAGGKKRGYLLTLLWVEDIKKRYSPLSGDSEASEASESYAHSGPEGNL